MLHLKILAIGLPVFFAGFILTMLMDLAPSGGHGYVLISSFSMLLLGGLATVVAAGIWAWRSRPVEALLAAGSIGVMTLVLAWFGAAGGFGDLNPHLNPGTFGSLMFLFLTMIAVCELFVLIALIAFGRQLVSRRHNSEMARNPPKS